MKTRLLVVVSWAILAGGILWNPPSAMCEKGHKLLFYNQFSARAMPLLGVADEFGLNYRYYFSDSDSILFKNNNVGFGIFDSISPATNSVGVFAEVEPIAIFKLRVQYEYVQHFGAFTAMLVFPDKNSDYSDSELDYLQDEDKAVWATGEMFTVMPTFQIMVGRFVALDMLKFRWYDMNKEGYFYEPTEDTLAKMNDYFFTNEAVIGIALWKRDEKNMLLLGTRHLYFSLEESGKQRQELDGVLVWMREKLFFMENPTIMTAIGGYLDDQYRTKDVMIGLVFRFEYSLIE